MDLVADLGGIVALGEGGLLDLADRLAGGSRRRWSRWAMAYSAATLAAQRTSSGLGTPPPRIAVTLGYSWPCQR
jgi:hypothetical protein